MLSLLGDSLPGSLDSIDSIVQLTPPPSFDFLFKQVEFAHSRLAAPRLDSPWVRRAFSINLAEISAARYKPVARKVRPVPTYMPNPSAQAFKRIKLPALDTLPIIPPPLSVFQPSERLSRERLDLILATITPDFLTGDEIALLAHVLWRRQAAIAFTDDERGTFSRAYYPDYEIPVIEHTPWADAPITIPRALRERVGEVIRKHEQNGKYEHSSASYRSSIFPVAKKDGDVRLVLNAEQMNSVTIRDAGLPPRVDDFVEGHIGCVVYMLADLLAGYDGRVLALTSRDLTTFHTQLGARRLTCLPQGATNAVTEFQRCVSHALDEERPQHADNFVDDCTIKGPRSRYNDQPIEGNPAIRRWLYEFASTMDRVLARFVSAGLTASGKKIVLATPELAIVGSIVSADGVRLHHGLVAKILKWPPCANATAVRGFLGVAGVGRRWIEGFSRIARPLTRLTTKDAVHQWGEEEQAAMDELKRRITTAPILRLIDYELAKQIAPGPRNSDHGLVILAVDSSMYGAGWVIYQVLEIEKHPVLFGSCTFNKTEAAYSQPKLELYGVFRALKETRHHLWGIHFRLDADAKFLAAMIKSPDLPNAPMTRWIQYSQLFDFQFNHILAAKHAAPDGLSRRGRATDDTDESDAEAYLDATLGMAEVAPRRTQDSTGSRVPVAFATTAPRVDSESLPLLRRTTLCGRDGDPFIAREFGQHTAEANETDEAGGHRFGAVDGEPNWAEIRAYLTNDTLPERCAASAQARNCFLRQARRFVWHDGRLWRRVKSTEPLRLVIEDIARRGELLAIAHNDCGHRGRDATYSKLRDCFWWPNLYMQVSYFVLSCLICQLRSKQRPVVPLSPTWSSSVLRKFFLDTTYLEVGLYGCRYIMKAVDDVSGWPEARASKKNDSSGWARFIYEDIISRFGCIPLLICDGGPEFKGATRTLLERYGVTVVLSSPYHPEGNGVAERSHQTLVNSLLKACGTKSSHWPQYLHATLLAVRTTVRRATGFTPYYLVYGQHPVFPFDIADRSWRTLEWDSAKTTEDLIALRARQIAQRDDDVGEAAETLQRTRTRAVEDFMRRNAARMTSGRFEPGAWVLRHETWLDAQHGHKSALRWTGPYLVVQRYESGSYQIAELDGTVIKETVAASRLKLFHYRVSAQSIDPEAYIKGSPSHKSGEGGVTGAPSPSSSDAGSEGSDDADVHPLIGALIAYERTALPLADGSTLELVTNAREVFNLTTRRAAH